MEEQQDFNNLPKWLRQRMEERRLTVDELSMKSKLSRTQIFSWLKDESRPTSTSMLKIVHVLSGKPVWKKRWGKDEWYPKMVEVTLEEALQQYVEKKNGRPKGSGGTSSVRTRGRA